MVPNYPAEPESHAATEQESPHSVLSEGKIQTEENNEKDENTEV